MKRFVTLSAFAAFSSALLIHASAQACDGHEGKGGPRARMDVNADGKVTQQEMLAAKTARFDATDTNKDGKVTAEEREAVRAAHRPHQGKGHPARHGDQDDDDRPATKADLTAKVAEHFKRLDRNGDGVLTGEEFEHRRGRRH